MNLSKNFNSWRARLQSRGLSGVIFLLFAASCGGADDDRAAVPRGSASLPAISYAVRGVGGLPNALEVEVCTEGFDARTLALPSAGEIQEAWRGGRPQRVERGRVIVLDDGARAGCTTYRVRVDLGPYAGILEEGTLLVRPRGAPSSTSLTLRFDESAATWVTPYVRAGSTLSPRSSFLERTTTWARADGGRAMILDASGVELRLVILPGPRAVSDDELARHVMRALALGKELAPERYPPVVLVAVAPAPVPPGEAPIPFGLARRGGGASALFVLDERATAGDLAAADWVSVHELSHFAFPAMTRHDAWLTEGRATYHQEVLRARGGLISPREAWTRLHRGFTMGREAGTGRPLHEESRAMFDTHAFKRVYWAGAAHALMDDVELRARGDTLEAMLERAFDGVPFDTWMTFDDYVARIEGVGFEGGAERARAAREATGFPDVTDVYATLGIRARGAELLFDEDAASVSARSAIVGGDL
jgi:hypothetical protein